MSNQFRSSRRRFVASAALMALTSLAVPQLAQAFDEQSTGALNVDAKGVALKGFDAVSYFLSGDPVEGKAELIARYEGTTYQFANSQNRDAFVANPAKYVPAYGGFCAMGKRLMPTRNFGG